MPGFLDRLLGALTGEAPARAAPSEHDLRLAATALLFEVVRADGRVDPEERAVLGAAVRSAFDLADAEVEALVREAEEASRSTASLHDLTSGLDAALSPEAKKRIVELAWLVAFADRKKDAHEEHLVRQIATLLHVRHPDFIDAKLRAREQSGQG